MFINVQDQISALSCWQSRVTIEALDGGITNHNYRVSETSGREYVVRLGTDIPVHHINRKNELAIATAAWKVGLSPAIVHAEEGVLVMDYIKSVTLEPEIVREKNRLQSIVELVKKCHLCLPKHLSGSPPMFWVFHVVRDYASSLGSANSRHVAMLERLTDASELLEQAAGPFDIVFGHNDLLAANILDDGQRLWLIDWEYAGYNTPLFDLGGLASNNGLVEEDERWMLEAYFETSVTDELWRRYQAMKTASLLRETMWSMIAEEHSTIAFDYATYTDDNLARFDDSYAAFRRLD